MPTHASPLDVSFGLGQRGRREPSHAETQRQGIPNYEPHAFGPLHMAERRGAIRDAAVEDATVVRPDVVLGLAVEQDVEVRADMYMAELEGSR